jgi:hypothetical protein
VSSGASLLHFDAKAHLVVSRRVLDSLTPGWLQLGAIWLPLPHILNALPAQNDRLYQSGAFASGLGFVGFVCGLAGLGWAAARATRDPWAGVVAVAVPAMNPAWLYLQATPLTEPLFLGLAGGGLYFAARAASSAERRPAVAAAVCCGLACLVRYEAWPLAAAVLAVVAWTGPGGAEPRARRAALLYGIGLVGPVLLYGLHSWAATGVPFHAIGSENLTEPRARLLSSLGRLASGVAGAFGLPLTLASAAALAALLLHRGTRTRPLTLLAAASLAPALVTLTAYFAGHPTKARYPLLLAPALALALAAATSGRRATQAAVLALAALQSPAVPSPLPVIVESRRDRRDVAERAPVVAALRSEYAGGHILASMGSLAPVLFELGIPLREIVHEGNGNWWTYAVVDPAREVSWVLIVDGDVLDQVRGYRPSFPEGFVPVAGFTRVVVYRRDGRAPSRHAGNGSDGDHSARQVAGVD